VIEWLSTALVIVFWPRMLVISIRKSHISYYLSHILLSFQKLPWPKSKPHSIVKTGAHNMRAGKGNAPPEWNTLVEEVGRKKQFQLEQPAGKFFREIKTTTHLKLTPESPRMDTTNAEFNRVLGGGLVPGVTLLGGEPGGLLQLCQTHHLKHYVSGALNKSKCAQSASKRCR
jgi:hypothetical protein